MSLTMDGMPAGDGEEAPQADPALIQELDNLWQKRTTRRGTLEQDLRRTKEMLDQLEDNACEKQQVESKVTNTVRRASVIADPARTAEAIAELDTVKFSSDEAAQTVNETWTRRMNRRGSLISDVAATKQILSQLAGADNTAAAGKLCQVQEMLSQMEASDEAEQEAIMMIQELWACQDVKSPTFQEDLEMTKAMLTTVEETNIEREKTAAQLVEALK